MRRLLHLIENGFIIRLRHMNICLSHGFKCVICQICTSYQLRIEIRRYGLERLPLEDHTYQLWHLEPEIEEHYICRCPKHYEIRGRFHCLFREGFGPLGTIMASTSLRCLGLFLRSQRFRRTPTRLLTPEDITSLLQRPM